MRKFYSRGLAVAAGAAVASVGGAVAVSAATSSPPAATPHSGAKAGAVRHALLRVPHVIGEVISDTSSGGHYNKGQITIKTPDGDQLTLSLTPKASAWKYQGPGTKPIKESASAIPDQEIVMVIGRGLHRHDLARHIVDLGYQAAS
jgi:hypothetical protein